MGVMDDIKRAGQEALAAEKAKEAAAAGATGGAITEAEAAPAETAETPAPEAAAPEAPAPAEAAPQAAAPEPHRPEPHAAAKPAAHAAPKPAPKPAEHKKRTYTVKSGDTLSAIGAHFGVSWQEIAKVNRIPNPDLIYPGQVFVIPD